MVHLIIFHERQIGQGIGTRPTLHTLHPPNPAGMSERSCAASPHIVGLLCEDSCFLTIFTSQTRVDQAVNAHSLLEIFLDFALDIFIHSLKFYIQRIRICVFGDSSSALPHLTPVHAMFVLVFTSSLFAPCYLVIALRFSWCRKLFSWGHCEWCGKNDHFQRLELRGGIIQLNLCLSEGMTSGDLIMNKSPFEFSRSDFASDTARPPQVLKTATPSVVRWPGSSGQSPLPYPIQSFSHILLQLVRAPNACPQTEGSQAIPSDPLEEFQ